MPAVLITGANRGLGLEFVKQYASAGCKVHACCRAPEEAGMLQNLADGNPDIRLHRLDVADFDNIRQLAGELGGESIDLLISNAGVYLNRGHTGFGETDDDAWALEFRINTMAALKLAEAFLPHVARSKGGKMVFISSKMGSMGDNTSGGSYLYRSSKAALNAVVKSLAIDLAPHGIVVGLLHPGWVQTDMGGPNAWITSEESISGMRRVIDQLTLADAGKFYAYDGQIVPW